MLQRISPYLHFSDTQHGFRSGRSTTTALLPVVQHAATGFNQHCPPKRTVVLAVDFSKAFDTVNHTALLRSLCRGHLDSNSIRWICAYLRGRTVSCSFGGRESAGVPVKQGVPQGSVLSPALFNHYVASYPQSYQEHDIARPQSAEHCCSYADDFTAYASDTQYERAADVLSGHAGDVGVWAAGRDLIVSEQKSTVTLLTPQTQQMRDRPVVTLNGADLPVEPNPKILGVVFDPGLHFHKQVENIVQKANSRLNLLRLLSGTGWGQHWETMLATYKSIVGSLYTYCAPIWFPNTSETSRNKLQVLQNAGLRMATGVLKMTGIDDLHAEVRTLKVEDHLRMLCSQFLATCLQPNHVSLPIVTADSGPREMKQTLQRSFRESREQSDGSRIPTSFMAPLSDLLEDGRILDIQAARKAIHTRAVEEAIQARRPNRVLGVVAPDVSEEDWV